MFLMCNNWQATKLSQSAGLTKLPDGAAINTSGIMPGYILAGHMFNGGAMTTSIYIVA